MMSQLAREDDTTALYCSVTAHICAVIGSSITQERRFFRAGAAHREGVEIEENGLPAARAISDLEMMSSEGSPADENLVVKTRGVVEMKTEKTITERTVGNILHMPSVAYDTINSVFSDCPRVYHFPINWPPPNMMLRTSDQPFVQVMTQLGTTGCYSGQASCVQHEFLMLRDRDDPTTAFISPTYRWTKSEGNKGDMLTIDVAWWMIAKHDNLQRKLVKRMREACVDSNGKSIVREVPQWRSSKVTRGVAKRIPETVISVADGFWDRELEELKDEHESVMMAKKSTA
ncbi:hypothetical protein CPB85DRAFT_1290940 [Mucidula mucida]|nr:hypothetical protein CPB85DRAFT_1290940 [Mucidula mucida]